MASFTYHILSINICDIKNVKQNSSVYKKFLRIVALYVLCYIDKLQKIRRFIHFMHEKTPFMHKD